MGTEHKEVITRQGNASDVIILSFLEELPKDELLSFLNCSAILAMNKFGWHRSAMTDGKETFILKATVVRKDDNSR